MRPHWGCPCCISVAQRTASLKLDEHAITGGLDDPTLMLADPRVDEFATVRLQAA